MKRFAFGSNFNGHCFYRKVAAVTQDSSKDDNISQLN